MSHDPRPDNVPADRVVDFDLYHPPGLEHGFHEAWAALLAGDPPDLVWTPHNEGHWIAKPANREVWWREMHAWLDTYLKH